MGGAVQVEWKKFSEKLCVWPLKSFSLQKWNIFRSGAAGHLRWKVDYPSSQPVRDSRLTGGHYRLSCPRSADTALKPYLIHNLSWRGSLSVTQISQLTWGFRWDKCGGTLLTWTLWKATTNLWLIIIGLPVPLDPLLDL